MSFADDLRDMSSNYGLEQQRMQNIEDGINRIVAKYVQKIKEYCKKNAKQGKNHVSGYLYTSVYEVYEYFELVDKSAFKINKTRNGCYKYEPPDDVVATIIGRNSTSEKESIQIAERVKEGIWNQLKNDGFRMLTVDIEVGPKYIHDSGARRGYKRVWAENLYALYISIQW